MGEKEQLFLVYERALENNIPGRRDHGQRDDSPSRFLKGNFAPVLNEGCFHLEVVEGRVPEDLKGIFVRNGPNPRYDTSGLDYHPFDGAGMLHAVSFDENKDPPNYVRRWIRTKMFEKTEKAGFEVFTFGEITNGKFENLHYGVDEETGESMGTANTAIVAFNRQNYALYESDKPYGFRASFDPQDNLVTTHRETFGNELRHPVAAHPKVDMRKNEFMLFGYNLMSQSPHVNYSVVRGDGKITSTCQVPLPCPKMMHDMIITEHYSLLFDPNFNFEFTAIAKTGSPWVHHTDIPARFALMPRHCSDSSKVRWVDVKPCGLFHFANAFEDEGGVIKVYGCRSETMKVDNFNEIPQTKMHEWVIDPISGKCISERTLSEHSCDFPQVDQTRQGYKTRYLYAVEFESDLSVVNAKKSFPYFRSVLKYDLETGQVTRHEAHSLDGKHIEHISETVFAPSKRRDDGDSKDEDRGYLIYYAHDEIDSTSECVVLNAKTMKVEARLRTEERIPYGFHSWWIHEENCEPRSKL